MKNYSNQTLIDAFLSRDKTKFFVGAEDRWDKCKTTKNYIRMTLFFHTDKLPASLGPELMELASKVFYELTALHEYKPSDAPADAEVPKTPLLDGMFPSIESICKPLVDEESYLDTFTLLKEYLARCTYRKLFSAPVLHRIIHKHFVPPEDRTTAPAVVTIIDRIKNEFAKIHNAYVNDSSLNSYDLANTPTVQYLRSHYLRTYLESLSALKTPAHFDFTETLWRATNSSKFYPHFYKLMLDQEDLRPHSHRRDGDRTFVCIVDTPR